MPLSLPESVLTYFDISNGADLTQVAHCFTQDAVVFDEGHTHRGHAAIQAWQQQVQKKFEYTVEPLSASRQGDRLTVHTRVAGNFPGSPVQLNHVIDLAGDKITSVEIG